MVRFGRTNSVDEDEDVDGGLLVDVVVDGVADAGEVGGMGVGFGVGRGMDVIVALCLEWLVRRW